MPAAARRQTHFNPVRWLFAWLSGMMRFVITTSIFFAVMVYICYGIVQDSIRGNEVLTPDLRGKKLVEALVMLKGDEKDKSDDLNLKLEREEPNENVPPGFIVSQEPKPGVPIKADTPIRVVLSKGAPLLPVPDLVGETKISAGVRLRKIGLNVGNVTSLPTSEGPGGIIISTDPPGGSGVVQDAKVNLLISGEREGETHAMPRLDGLTLAEARDLLGQMGLTLAESTEVPANDVLPGQIHVQSPTPGEPVDGQTRITVAITPDKDYALWQSPPAVGALPDEGVSRTPSIPPIERLDGRPDEAAPTPTPEPTPDEPSINLDLGKGEGGDAGPKFMF